MLISGFHVHILGSLPHSGTMCTYMHIPHTQSLQGQGSIPAQVGCDHCSQARESLNGWEEDRKA